MSYVVLGSEGMQGKAVVQYLLDHTKKTKITTVDRIRSDDAESNKLRRVHKQIDDLVGLPKLKEGSVVVNCLPLALTKEVFSTVVEAGCHYVDLGGDIENTEYIQHYDQHLIDNKLVAMPDCGVAPGLVSALAGDIARQSNDAIIRIYCGGLPRYPVLPHGYKVTFSAAGLIQEYSGPAMIREHGRIKHVAAMDGQEPVFIDGIGVLEAAYTSGSLSLTPQYLDRVFTLKYKTLRYPGHWDWARKHIMPQKDPAGTLEKIVNEQKSHEDLLIIHLKYTHGHNRNWQYQTYRWDYEPGTGLSAMAQSTGFTVGMVAKLIHDGEVEPGFHLMHDLDGNQLIKQHFEYPCSRFSDRTCVK